MRRLARRCHAVRGSRHAGAARAAARPRGARRARGTSGSGHRRLAYFDNVKLLLICCVVCGHLLKPVFHHRRMVKALILLIYSFHMPLFLFLSGLFLDRGRLEGRSVARRVLKLLALGLVARYLRLLTAYLLGATVSFTPFVEVGWPWFLFVLAGCHALAWLLRACPFWVVGVASVLLSLGAGYFPQVGDVLCLSRLVVFFPFFWLGHALSPAQLTDVLGRRWVRAVAAGLACGLTVVCLLNSSALFSWHKLLMGRYPYAVVGSDGCTWVARLCCYLASLTMGFAVLELVPRVRIEPLSTWGTRTLWVYLLHYGFVAMLSKYGVVYALAAAAPWGWVLLLPLGVALACLLSLPPWERLGI